MLYNCQKSCYVCIDEKEHLGIEDCEDYEDECPEWAFQGKVKITECFMFMISHHQLYPNSVN